MKTIKLKNPLIPYENWTIESNLEMDMPDMKDVILHLEPEQKKGFFLKGDIIRERLKDKPVLNASVLDYLLKHQTLIPESWKGKYVYFWGTIYRDSYGDLYVRYLYFFDGGWYSYCSWLDYDWYGFSPAAVRAISPVSSDPTKESGYYEDLCIKSPQTTWENGSLTFDNIMINRLKLIIFFGIILIGSAFLGWQNAQNQFPLQELGRIQQHIAPNNLYPNPNYTPGKADTLNLSDLQRRYDGKTYSQSHRNVTQATKRQVLKNYRLTECKGEIDHFFSVALGGSNEASNLWCEADNLMWNGKNYGYKTKDTLEAELVREIKSNTITPQQAWNCLVKDWVKCYDEKRGDNLGSMQDPDNE